MLLEEPLLKPQLELLPSPWEPPPKLVPLLVPELVPSVLLEELLLELETL